MSKWPLVPLGEVISHRKEFNQIDDFERYKRCRVQLHARGIILRDDVDGAEIKTKKQQVCRSGELLVAEIDAKHGGYGIVPDDLEGAIVSSHYFLFEINEPKIDRRFLGYYIQTPAFFDQVTAQGSTNYAAIRPGHVLGYEIPLPPLSEQQMVVEWIDAVATRVDEADSEAESTFKTLDNLLMSAFHEIAEGVPRRPLEEIAPLTRRSVTIDPTAEYPGISARSFGRGTFHNLPLLGSDITWQKPYEVKAGDILVSNIKAWEGAIAVVSPEDNGRFGSHRYLTFACKEGVATPRFVCFYLLSPEGLFHVGEASPGSADRNRTTGSKAMQNIPVPVPTYERQLWFDQLYEKVEIAKRTMTQAAEERNAILPSLLNQVFSGEVAA